MLSRARSCSLSGNVIVLCSPLRLKIQLRAFCLDAFSNSSHRAMSAWFIAAVSWVLLERAIMSRKALWASGVRRTVIRFPPASVGARMVRLERSVAVDASSLT